MWSNKPTPQTWRLLQIDDRGTMEFAEKGIIASSNDSLVQTLQLGARSLYNRLQPSQTRILRLHAGDGEKVITCDLLEGDLVVNDGLRVRDAEGLEVQVAYEAISYSWGELVLDRIVICNGIPLPVTAACGNALRFLQRPDETRYLWIDYVCINQQDEADKSNQVRTMFNIFREADGVLAWFGVPNLETHAFLHVDSAVACLSLSTKSQPASIEHQEQHQQAQKLRAGLLSILHNPWFSRLWVRQECFAAKHLHVVFGYETWPFDRLKNHIAFHTSDTYRSDDRENHLDAIDLIFRYGNGDIAVDNSGPVGQAIRLLTSGRTLSYSNPRDLIYGALGMLSHSRDALPWAEFPVDYRKTISEVYQDFTAFMVEHSPCKAIPALYESRRDRPNDLPSWTINLRQTSPRFCKFHDSGGVPGFPGFTDGVSAASLRGPLRVGQTLRLYGYAIGTITHRTAIPQPSSQPQPGNPPVWHSPDQETSWSKSPFTPDEVSFPDDLIQDCHYECVSFKPRYIETLFQGLGKRKSDDNPSESEFTFCSPDNGGAIEERSITAKTYRESAERPTEAWNTALVSEAARLGSILVLCDVREDPVVLRQNINDGKPRSFAYLGPASVADRKQLWSMQYLAHYATFGRLPPCLEADWGVRTSKPDVYGKWELFELT